MRSRRNGSRVAHRLRRQPDGLGHWRETLDGYIWLLRRGGISEATIVEASGTSLGRHRRVRPLAVPSQTVLLYSRVLTFWRNDHRYLDGEGNPKALPRAGRRLSFQSLVRHALDDGDPERVLTVLARHGVVSQDRRGYIHLLVGTVVPTDPQQRAHALGYALMAIEGVIDTCRAALCASRPSQHRGRAQRMAVSEKFDPRYLRDYDKFTRDTLGSFLNLHNVWLKEHEIKESKRRSRRYLVGVNVNGIIRHLA
jgi:Family of unknown function (DUF6502)